MSARICRLAAVILFAAVAFAAVGKAQPAAEPLPVAASQEIGGTAGMSGPGATETLAEREATVSGFVEARLQVLGDHLHGLFAALPGLPAELAAAGARLTDELSDRGLARGLPAAGVVRRSRGRRRAAVRVGDPRMVGRVETAPVATPGDRVRLRPDPPDAGARPRLLLRTPAASAAFLLFTWPPKLRRLVLGYLARRWRCG